MNSIESGATVTVPNYPNGRVIGLYGLLGGAIGSSIIGLPIAIIGVIAGAITPAGFGVMQAMTILFSIIILGSLIGLLPSLVTGVVICHFQIYFDSSNDVLPLFIIGCLSTFIVFLAIILLPAGLSASTLDNVILSGVAIVILFLPVSILGGISAIVTGRVVLPKHKY